MNTADLTARAFQSFAAKRYVEAAAYAQRVLQQSPADPGALTLLGRLALISGEPDVAHDVLVRVVTSHSQVAAPWLDLATALRNLNRHEEALKAAQQGVTLDARAREGWITLGEIHLSRNEREAAREAFHRALTIDRLSVAAYRGLAQLEDALPDSDLVRRMQELSVASTLTVRERAELHYGLAQIFRRSGERSLFIRHLLAANAAQRALCTDGRAEYAAMFDRIEAAFTRDAFSGLRSPRPDAQLPIPVFVLGMPRSGTTLVERLFAAHPDVDAGGEIDYMRGPLRRAVERETGEVFPVAFASLAPQVMSAMATAYLKRLQRIGPTSRYVTDKTPGNFHLLGLLCVLFPQAPIVHVRRDPMDTCFSILQYPFDDRSPHTCDMTLLAYVYGRYVRLMKRWYELFPDQIVTVDYEQLVQSPAQEGRRMLEACGLEWSDDYLEFHRSSDAVRTFSALQVRRPINTGSIGAWREFATELAPLEKALRDELVQ